MIRVGFVDQSGDLAGGAEESLALLMDRLPADIKPTAILFGDGAYAQRLRDRGIDVHIFDIPPALAAVQRERLPLSSMPALGASSWRLANTFRKLGIELAYTNTMKAHVIGAPAARLARIPCLVHVRDIPTGGARQVLRSIGWTCSQGRIAISEAVARSLSLPRTHVVMNPLDLEAYRSLPSRDEARRILGIEGHEPLVAIVGRINRWKGHDRFVRIAARVAAQTGGRVRFAIVGEAVFRDADFVDELREEARREGIEASLSFVPWQKDPRIAYAAMDILSNCSTGEPFGRTIIEAAAAGVPAVCFDDGGAPEAVVDGVTGAVVRAGDEEGFARAIARYVVEPAALATAARRAREGARRFDAGIHAARIGEIVRKAAA